MFTQFKLLHKQVAWVAAVLVCELFLIGTLQILLAEAEREVQRGERAYRVSVEANQLVKECSDTATNLVLLGLTGNEEYEHRYNTLSEDVPRKVAILNQISSEFTEDKESMRRVTSAAENWNMLLAKCRALMLRRGESGFTENMINLANREIKPHMKELTNDLAALSEHHRLAEIAQTAKMNSSKSRVGYILVAGGIMQVVIALMSILFFSRSITDRLAILSDNTLRLGRGLPLHKAGKGADEIAQLDTFFHEMATALATASTKERAIVDAMPVGFITMSSTGSILAANPQALSMLAGSANQLIGKSLSDFVRASDGSKIPFETIKESSYGHLSDFQLSRMDTTVFPAQLLINRVIDSENELLLCNLLDLTERHEVERLKKEFLSIVSHDLKTPLTAIKGALYLLSIGSFGELSERGQRVVQGSQEEAQRLVRLVSNLLDVARIEAGRVELNLCRVDVDSVLARSVSSVSMLAEEKNVKLATTSAFDGSVIADADRLVQVLVNLLSNAIKYSPPESTIKILCHPEGEDVEFKVIDEGPGIPEQAQTKIFERFEQVSLEDRTERGGVGLGLSICKLFVEAHGGSIGVESTIGQGSSFWFKIPCTLKATPFPTD